MPAASWFGVFDTTKPLEQGVIVQDLPYFEITSQNKATFSGNEDVNLVTNDVIIMTQSCDLAQNKVKHIHVCPIYTLEDYFEQQGINTLRQKGKEFEALKKNRETSKFLTNRFNLATFPNMTKDFYVVALNQAIVISSNYIKAIASEHSIRPILKPPYREAMAQAYGLYFMRVGNPVDIEIPQFS